MIEYQLVSAAADLVVVRHAGRPDRTPIVLLLLALPVGWMVWRSIEQGRLTLPGSPVALVVGGLFAVSSVWAIGAQWRPGHLLRFDATAGVAEVTAEDGSTPARWPLAHIAAVETHQLRINRPSGQGGTTWYHVAIRLRDGAQIEVLRSRSAADRDAIAGFVRAMRARSPAAGADPTTAPTLPPSVATQRDGGAIQLSWRTHVPRRALLSLGGMLGSGLILLGLVIQHARARGGAWGWLPLAGMAALALMPLGLIARTLWQELRTHGRTHTLRVDHDGLHYLGRGGILAWPARWTIPRGAVQAIRVVWGTGRLEFVASPASGGPDTEAAVHTIDLGRESPGGVVAVEQWLQHECSARWGQPIA